MYKAEAYKIKWQIIPCFEIHLHVKDLALLKKILFRCGTIKIDHKKHKATYSVRSSKDLINVIIPHFDNYPLLSQKTADFLLFKSALSLIKLREHLTIEGFKKIISIRAEHLPATLLRAPRAASMNKGLKRH